MNWEAFYLVCFVVGFVFSLVSVLGGGGHWHLAHFHVHVPGHASHAGHGAGSHSSMSPLNVSTISAFLAWFGGVGYLLTRYSSVWTLLALTLAFVAGIAGAAMVFWFLVKVMLRNDRTLDPSDYDMVGVLGSITSPVHERGTGEMIFLRDGARCSAAARSETGTPIARDTEVIVTRFEGGIAYVRPWEEMASR